jgi:thiamine transporter ThiT
MTIDQITLVASLVIVAGILGWGVLTMARGGTYNVKNSNRIMRYRVIFQALALVVILVLMWLRKDGNA